MKTKKLDRATMMTSGMLGLIMLVGVVMTGAATYADDSSVDQVTLTVPVACMMSGTGQNSHNTSISNGQYDSAIGETTLKAFCNDADGFAIYAIGYTGNIEGKSVLTSTILGDTYDIATGTAISGDNSNWAMKVGTISSPTPTYPIIIVGSVSDSMKEVGDLDYSSFQEVPDEYTKVAYRTAATDINPEGQNVAKGATLTTTYQAYISRTQPAGTYSGRVKYTLVHPHDAIKPEKPLSTCTTPVPNVTYMQEISSSNLSTVLASMTEDAPYYLRDRRDNQPYCVSKMKDGKLWMTEDLNLTGGTLLSSVDTDFESSYVLPTTNGWVVNGNKLVLPLSADKNEGNNNLTNNSEFSHDNYAYVFNSKMKENCGANGQNLPCYSYYSWDAATVGSGRTLNVENNDAPYSICPKGWKLPTSGNTASNGWQRGNFYALALAYGSSLESSSEDSSATTGASFYDNAGPGATGNFMVPGFYMNGAFNSGGQYGLYWSATSYASTSRARSMAISSSFINVANYASRRSGFSVRCVVR